MKENITLKTLLPNFFLYVASFFAKKTGHTINPSTMYKIAATIPFPKETNPIKMYNTAKIQFTNVAIPFRKFHPIPFPFTIPVDS